VELDRRAGDETPRVTIKRFQPLTDLAKRTRLQMTVRVADTGAARQIAQDLANARESNGLLRFIVPIASGGEATIIAGRDYALDAELAARIERVTGEGSVDLSVQEPPKLALVG
jgi:DNA polymerase-3 subunit alpha